VINRLSLGILACLCGFTALGDEQPVPTMEEIRALWSATATGDHSYISKENSSFHYVSAGAIKPEPRSTRSETVYASGDKKRLEKQLNWAESIDPQTGVTVQKCTENTTEINTLQQCRSLNKNITHNLQAEGTIQHSPFVDTRRTHSPVDQLRAVMAYFRNEGTVRRGDNGEIILERTLNQFQITMTLDPSRAYMPTLYRSVAGPENKLNEEVRFDDYRQINGYWIPFAIEDTYAVKNDAVSHYYEHTIVESFQPDASVPDETFELPFPEGTWVRDKISGIEYIMGRTDINVSENDAADANPATLSITSLHPAGEQKLKNSADQAVQLLNEATTKQQIAKTWMAAIAVGAASLVAVIAGTLLRRRRRALRANTE